MKKLVKKYNDPIFKGKICLLMGLSEKEFYDWFRKEKIRFEHKVYGDDGGHTRIDNGAWQVVWVKKADDIPCLVHETIHLVNSILKSHEIVLNEDSEEVLTYLVDYWFKRFWEDLKKKEK